MKRGTRFSITLFNLTVSGLCWLFVISSLPNLSHPNNYHQNFGNPVQYVLSYLAYPMLAFVTVASTAALVASFIHTLAGRIAWRQAQTLLAWTMWGVTLYVAAGLLTSAPIRIGVLAWLTPIAVFCGAGWLATEAARYTRLNLK